MSILKFLDVIAEASGLAASKSRAATVPRRKLAVESLECRAVLTVLHPAFAEAAMATEAVVADAAAALDPVTDPVTAWVEDPTGGPAENPPPDGAEGGAGGIDEGGGGVSIYPAFSSYEVDNTDGWVRMFGSGTDDQSLEGLTVYFSTDRGLHFVATFNAEGEFFSPGQIIEAGTSISAIFMDSDGNYAESVSLMV